MMKLFLLLLSLATIVSAFAPSSHVRWGASVGLKLSSSPDLPPTEDGDDDLDSVDWDAEWKKVVKNQDQPQQRPGNDFYKSDAEITVTKAVNRAAGNVQKATSNIQMPTTSNLTSDWRFWIGILAFVSIVTAVLTAPPQMDAPDSYYI